MIKIRNENFVCLKSNENQIYQILMTNCYLVKRYWKIYIFPLKILELKYLIITAKSLQPSNSNINVAIDNGQLLQSFYGFVKSHMTMMIDKLTTY